MKKYLLLLIVSFLFINVQSQNWDINLLKDINANKEFSEFQKTVSNSIYPITVGTPLAIYCVGLITDNKAIKRKAIKIVGTLAINTAVTLGSKYLIDRSRPFNDYPTVINAYNKPSDPSFPSGHTSTAFALATSVSLEYKKWYIVIPSFLYASSVGYSRMYLGEHYPSDVLAGAAVGIGTAYLSNWLSKKIFK